MTWVKFSFQSLKFVTNKKADNRKMCLLFQTAYYGDGQQKHPTTYGFSFVNSKIPCSKVTTILLNLTECVDSCPV